MDNNDNRFSDFDEIKNLIYDAESRTLNIPTSDDEPDEDVEQYRRKETEREKERSERLKKKNDKKVDQILKQPKKRGEEKPSSPSDTELRPKSEKQSGKKKFDFKRLLNKKLIVAVAIVLLLTFAVVLFANSDALSFDSIKNFVQYGIFNQDPDHTFPIDVKGESVSAGNFQAMGRYLVYASDSKFASVNSYGRTVYSSSMAFSAPVMVTSNDYILLYNLGGTGFEIDMLDKNVYTSSAENKIVTADIIDNGTYALVTQSDGYLSKLYVYNKDNEQIFAYSYADYYITSVTLSSSGRFAAVSGVSALDGTEISAVYIHDFTEEEPVVFKEFEGNFIYEIEYLSDSVVCAVADHSAFGIKTRSGDTKETSFEGKTLTAYDINTDTDTFSVSLSRSGDGRNCDVYNFNSSGDLSSSFSTDLRIISLSTYKGRVAALSSDTVYLYNKSGSLISETAAGLDTHAIALYSDSDAYVLSSGDISTLRL